MRETVRPNPFIKGQYDIYTDGRHTGTIRPDPFVNDRYDLSDDHGRTVESTDGAGLKAILGQLGVKPTAV